MHAIDSVLMWQLCWNMLELFLFIIFIHRVELKDQNWRLIQLVGY